MVGLMGAAASKPLAASFHLLGVRSACEETGCETGGCEEDDCEEDDCEEDAGSHVNLSVLASTTVALELHAGCSCRAAHAGVATAL